MRLSRRAWFRLAFLGIPSLSASYGFGVEPRSLRERRLNLAGEAASRFAYFTDVHFKGDPGLLNRIVNRINAARPEFALFGGDLVEEARFLPDDEAIEVAGGRVRISGYTCTGDPQLAPAEGQKNVALIHYPTWADRLKPTFDLILAGHSHGGQVRLPFVGPLITPMGVGAYALGRFVTQGGPLYVSSGVGTFFLNVRFLCPPELVFVEP